ncbi:MAG: polyphosphate polymerase domain-containing protein, partial [Butyrivibrio sp.]|nr:polyphosphate polymerase domain-containing protein [Butyrivibrio sp.]
VKYRHEFKYMVDAVTEGVLLAKAGAVLKSDGNVLEDGRYVVRSLYFDDVDDGCLRENLGGTDNRSKFRIRYYNGDTDFLRLEKKSKSHGMTLKESCRITKEEFWQLFHGKSIGVSGNEKKDALVADFLGRGMRPKVIVTYERIPFVYKAGNVRVTFDRKLASSGQVDKFLSGDYRQRPVFEVGKSLLEVKFDEYLPVHIKAALQTDGLRWTTFSKYHMCRTYGV